MLEEQNFARMVSDKMLQKHKFVSSIHCLEETFKIYTFSKSKNIRMAHCEF